MAILSMKTRKKGLDVAIVSLACAAAWILQLTVMNQLFFQGAICNLPLTVTVLWGYVVGSSLPQLRADELRIYPVSTIFLRQILSGSVTGALVGALFAALYSSVSPVYPIAFPLIGFIAGYFSMKNLNQETLFCIPLTLLATVMAEGVMALQLGMLGRPYVFDHLSHIILPEALLNALIAPFVYFPLRHWYEYRRAEAVVEQ